MTISVECPVCSPATTFLSVHPAAGQSEVDLRDAWKEQASVEVIRFRCLGCGKCYLAVDDEVLSTSGGFLALEDNSEPGLDSVVSGSAGSVAGGSTVRVSGSSFVVEGATLSVSVGGVPATNVVVIDDSTAEFDVPEGTLICCVAVPTNKMQASSAQIGTFVPGELLRVEGKDVSCFFREASPDHLVVDQFTGMIVNGDELVGQTSGAVFTFGRHVDNPYIVGETLVGDESGATAEVVALTPLRIGSLVGVFTSERVVGQDSGVACWLADPPTSGLASISVSNDYGTQPDGRSVLIDAFTYTQ